MPEQFVVVHVRFPLTEWFTVQERAAYEDVEETQLIRKAVRQYAYQTKLFEVEKNHGPHTVTVQVKDGIL